MAVADVVVVVVDVVVLPPPFVCLHLAQVGVGGRIRTGNVESTVTSSTGQVEMEKVSMTSDLEIPLSSWNLVAMF